MWRVVSELNAGKKSANHRVISYDQQQRMAKQGRKAANEYRNLLIQDWIEGEELYARLDCNASLN